jgi:hypothetical protein
MNRRHFGNPGSYGGNDGYGGDEPERESRAALYAAFAIVVFVIGLLAYLP